MWRSLALSDCDARSDEVKQPIQYCTPFFADKVRQLFCDETILYAAQSDGTEFKCNVSEIKRYVGYYYTLLL